MTTELRPLVGVGVVLLKGNKVLLGKRRGSHGAGEYSLPGGHLEYLESFHDCAAREVMEETGLEISDLRFLRVLNSTHYAPKHYVDLAFAASWKGGEPEVREPDKLERWDWCDLDNLPSPLFTMASSAINALLTQDPSRICEDLPRAPAPDAPAPDAPAPDAPAPDAPAPDAPACEVSPLMREPLQYEVARALTEALDLFDLSWCTEHGHAPSPDVFTRITELRKLVKKMEFSV